MRTQKNQTPLARTEAWDQLQDQLQHLITADDKLAGMSESLLSLLMHNSDYLAAEQTHSLLELLHFISVGLIVQGQMRKEVHDAIH
ncbi:hypothetical protein EOD41_10690 [Mucilaginibacter limnophilus]|uniref:Uncharacterized protein n=1 Tax=Mucilaginibacter limnophilus TaxID=1932778 RepID=A0A3S2UPB6_9SPHI|nr:hypothetical protein [Mucilaginibacter limnophilus]RVU01073.1 hypothetical protein EOD41_10690 [Mucilaginibacter limnophilus]